MSDELIQRRRALSMSARRLHGDAPESAYLELDRVASWCRQHEVDADVYGEGPGLAAFEARVAELLGLRAARFMPSGTMAQQIAARIWCERTSINRLGMHPTCHIELHEQRGYQRLHGLDAVLVGQGHRPMTTDDLLAVSERIGCLIVELPTRENGGQLAGWDDLIELTELAAERGIPVHLDGARLWEAAAGYDRSLDEICGLFDSVYVSFYKGIGALPGAMLAGPVDVIDEAAIWQRRHGGNLFTQTANWVSADMRLDEQIANMPGYLARARELAAVLNEIEGVAINPTVPHVNMFHVFVNGEEEALLASRDNIAANQGIWLFGGLQATDLPGSYMFEVAVGQAALDLDLASVAECFRELVA